MLRALGAGRHQVTRSVLFEAFVVGLVGLVLALIYTFWWSNRHPAYDDTRVVRRPPPAA